MAEHGSGTPVCPDCGEALDRHCIVWPLEGDPFLQCQPAVAADKRERE